MMLSTLTVSTATAIDLERLVMPGPVIEGHADTESDCSACHVAFSREKQRTLCLDCHEDVAADLQARTGFHGRDSNASTDACKSCHTEHEGRDAVVVQLDENQFNHELTDYPLIGKHTKTACADCHDEGMKYREASTLCYDCHEDDDEHRGGLGQECADCHTPVDWLETSFDHFEHAGYALLGGHADTDCVSCHKNQVYEDTPTDCYACHQDDDEHDGLNGTDCAFCHTEKGWKETLFDHAAQTDFALLGRHRDIACSDCHQDNKFEVKLEQECVACHQDDDEHEGFNGTQCADCHNSVDWEQTTFDHSTATEFPLLGEHADVVCTDCHEQPLYEQDPPSDCFGCHEDDDPHEGQEGQDCASCHNEQSWTEQVAFDHDLGTSFPLIGQHRDTECAECHETKRFTDASDQCVDCHRDDDIHNASLGLDCGECHNPNDWSFWIFDHDRQTQFPLDGAHQDLDCASCHVRPMDDRLSLPKDCAGCHRDDDVHHGEFGNDCLRCHNTRTFKGARRI